MCTTGHRQNREKTACRSNMCLELSVGGATVSAVTAPVAAGGTRDPARTGRQPRGGARRWHGDEGGGGAAATGTPGRAAGAPGARAARSARSRTRRRTPAGLTPRQRKVLEVIRDWVERFGYPPSVREIGDAVGPDLHLVGAPPAADAGDEGLPAARPEPHPRASTCAARTSSAARRATAAAADVDRGRPRADARPDAGLRPAASADIAAGGPILAEQAVESVFPLPREIVGEGTLFLLNVRRRLDGRGRDHATATGWWCASSRSPRTARSSPR